MKKINLELFSVIMILSICSAIHNPTALTFNIFLFLVFIIGLPIALILAYVFK